MNDWTDDRVETLRRLWNEGHSCGEIAKTLGHVTREAVSGKVWRLGLNVNASEIRLKKNSDCARARAGFVRQPANKPTRVKTFKPSTPGKVKVANNPLGSNGKPKPPALKLAGQGAVFEEPVARAPTVVIPFRDEPTLGAKPWIDRTPFECTWIVAGDGADALCCAAPIHGRGWCLGHYKRGISPSSPNKRASEPLQARATARFA